YTTMRDWIAVCPEVSATATRLYWIIRSLMLEKGRKDRRLSIDQLCWLLPGINGKPTGETRVKDALRELEAIGLLSNPEGNVIRRWVVDTNGKRTRENYRRWQVHDIPRNYDGPRSAFELLDAYPGPGWKQAAKQDHNTESRKSAPQSAEASSPAKTSDIAGHTESRKSDSTRRKSDSTRRKSVAPEPVPSQKPNHNKLLEETLGNQSIDAREDNGPASAGEGSREGKKGAPPEQTTTQPTAEEWALQLVTALR